MGPVEARNTHSGTRRVAMSREEPNAGQAFAETVEAATVSRIVASKLEFKERGQLLVSSRKEKITYQNEDGCFVTEDKSQYELLACGHFVQADCIAGACTNHPQSRLICSACIHNAVCASCLRVFCPDCMTKGLCKKCNRRRLVSSFVSSVFKFLFGGAE